MMNQEFVYDSLSEADTRVLGEQLGRVIPSGLAVALNGELGSGKTCLVRAVCHGLGGSEHDVNSPTFVLMQTYTSGRIPVIHFDTYRLADLDEFLAIGGEDFLLDAETVCFVEWAERIAEVFPADHLRIDIRQTAAEARRFHITSGGPVSTVTLQKLVTQLHEKRPEQNSGL